MSKKIQVSRATMAFAAEMLHRGMFQGEASYDIGCDYLLELQEDFEGNKGQF